MGLSRVGKITFSRHHYADAFNPRHRRRRSAYVNISHDHDVAYLDTYPLDGKFAKIRGLHKIEINDKVSKGVSAAVAFNFSPAGVPLAVAFKAGVDFTRARTYRTHTQLAQAQSMLSENDLPTYYLKPVRK